MKIAILGDLHNHIDCHTIFNYLSSKKEHDLIIQCGDFGFLWDGKQADRNLIKKLSSRLRTPLIVVPGNHENYNLIEQLPEIEMFGAKCYKLKHNIFYVKRGEVLEIEGRKFLTLSGGLSIDRGNRILDQTWWKQELWTCEEENNLLDKLTKIGYNSIDYVISHTAPGYIVEKILTPLGKSKIEDPTAKFFEHLDGLLTGITEWHFAHLHEDTELDHKYYCHYHKVHEMEI